MNTCTWIIVCLAALQTCTRAGKLLSFTAAHKVDEGEWASFSCTVKKGKAKILWKIGEFTEENGNSFSKISSQELTVRRYTDQQEAEKYRRNGTTDGLEILATAELDKVPVQCVVIPHNYPKSDREFSRFYILTVYPAFNTTAYASGGSTSQDSPGIRSKRSLSEVSSSAPASFSILTATALLLMTTITLSLTL